MIGFCFTTFLIRIMFYNYSKNLMLSLYTVSKLS